MAIRDIIELINSVGFSSPPAWVRPFHVLSTGEQFRVSVARALAERLITGETPEGGRGLVVLDEFTSVVDRTVAQIGCAAIARTLRREGEGGRLPQLVAVTCHYDVEEWLQPDWTYSPVTNLFQWRSIGTRPKSSWSLEGSITLHGNSSSTIII
jgi:ABC-type ATPase with predicted acetyltransferase domain